MCVYWRKYACFILEKKIDLMIASIIIVYLTVVIFLLQNEKDTSSKVHLQEQHMYLTEQSANSE
jgi:hypothetical protein